MLWVDIDGRTVSFLVVGHEVDDGLDFVLWSVVVGGCG